jgi:hypothetical protein
MVAIPKIQLAAAVAAKSIAVSLAFFDACCLLYITDLSNVFIHFMLIYRITNQPRGGSLTMTVVVIENFGWVACIVIVWVAYSGPLWMTFTLF